MICSETYDLNRFLCVAQYFTWHVSLNLHNSINEVLKYWLKVITFNSIMQLLMTLLYHLSLPVFTRSIRGSQLKTMDRYFMAVTLWIKVGDRFFLNASVISGNAQYTRCDTLSKYNANLKNIHHPVLSKGTMHGYSETHIQHTKFKISS